MGHDHQGFVALYGQKLGSLLEDRHGLPGLLEEAL